MTQVIEDVKLDFADVLIMPKRSPLGSRSEVMLERTFKFKHSPTPITGIPVIAANMDTIGTINMAKSLADYQMFTALHKFYSVEELTDYFTLCCARDYTFYSMGITDADLEKYQQVVKSIPGTHPRMICIDVANGYSRKFVDFVSHMRDLAPNAIIMAGNVVTPDMTYDLLERGADIVKIGIGPGSVCTTRKITGVGYPQLSAIMECADAAHGVKGHICGDGGITGSGDVCKAFAGGADFVMCGSLFAGHAECDGEIEYDIGYADPAFTVVDTQAGSGIIYNTIEIPKNMKFYGMSSKEAMDAHYGGKANYRAAEGKCVTVPYKGPVASTLEEVMGGLRSACTYTGAEKLKHLPLCTTFVRVNRTHNTLYGV